MSLLVVVIGVALLSMPALTARSARTARSALGPRARVRTACLSAACGIWFLGVGTILTASPLPLWWHDDGEASNVGLRHLSPGGPWAWTASGVIFGVGASWVVGVLRQSAVARRRASLPRWAATSVVYDDFAGAEVRVAPTLDPVAFAVPGRDRHVVVSESVARLGARERRAVLAHEGAHLRLRHDRHLLVLATYERVWGWVPGAPAVVAAHRRSIEQWADLDAARLSRVDRQAILQARSQLRSCSGITGIAPVTACGELASGSSLRDLAGITVFVATLIAAGAYSATHTVSDLSAAIAALH